MDDPFVACPYNPTHRVPRSRIQNHIIKCQAKYPPLFTCPYNATHRFSQEELKRHVRDCPSKLAMFPEERLAKATAARLVPKIIFQKDYLPENDPHHEMWDD